MLEKIDFFSNLLRLKPLWGVWLPNVFSKDRAGKSIWKLNFWQFLFNFWTACVFRSWINDSWTIILSYFYLRLVKTSLQSTSDKITLNLILLKTQLVIPGSFCAVVNSERHFYITHRMTIKWENLLIAEENYSLFLP